MSEKRDPAAGRHVAGTLTRMVLDHFRVRTPEHSIESLLELAGETRGAEVLSDDGSWSSYDEFRNLLVAAASLLGSVERLGDIGRDAALAAGSMPGSTDAMQALGSPGALLTQIGEGQASIITILDTETKELAPTEWELRSRFKGGFEPFEEFCAFTIGLDRLAPSLFGFQHIEVVEETCQCRGDDWCTAVIRWEATESAEQRAAYLETRLQLSDLRLEAFQRTVADLVSADDLGTVLTRIVSSAARAVRAPAFVLALDPLPWSTETVYSEGMSPQDALDVAVKTLALDSPEEMQGGMAVDVASTRRRYGRLVAIDADGSIMAHERLLLDAYARLAATALDSATALEDARRQALTARALLELATSLATITTTGEMATNLARAIPAVIDCDCGLVVLVDRGSATARIVAMHGFDEPVTSLIGFETPLSEEGSNGIRFYDDSTTRPAARRFMEASSLTAMSTVPVAVDGAIVGYLIVGVADPAKRLTPCTDLEERMRGLAGQASTALRNAALVEQIRHQAMHDSLTGLPNRTLIMDRAESMLARAFRNRTPCAAFFIDLDGFKDVNDTLGHAAGDELLRAVAARLMSVVRASDTVARLGGDEFVVLAEDRSLDAGAESVAERLLAVLSEPYQLSAAPRSRVRTTASIGIAEGVRMSAGELLRDADIALYRAKGAGKNRSVTFAAEMQTARIERVQLERDLRLAIANDEMFVVYQPIFDLTDQRVTGVEALLRWQHPTRGLVMPDDFIPELEETGLIVDVGRWVLNEACSQAAEWHNSGCLVDISINVSIRQLEHDDLLQHVREALAASGLEPSSLILEITESGLVRDAAHTVHSLQAIKALGVRLAVDDFGTGYSSLAYLRQFSIDTIKIDKSFIQGIDGSSESTALVRTLVQLGKSLGMVTLAEGIEDSNQLAALQREHCDSGQGYLVAVPLPAADVPAFLSASEPQPLGA